MAFQKCQYDLNFREMTRMRYLEKWIWKEENSRSDEILFIADMKVILHMIELLNGYEYTKSIVMKVDWSKMNSREHFRCFLDRGNWEGRVSQAMVQHANQSDALIGVRLYLTYRLLVDKHHCRGPWRLFPALQTHCQHFLKTWTKK